MTNGRELSGITPSGSLTLGNYLGALRRFVERQYHAEGYYFIADLHALTVNHDPIQLRYHTDSTAAMFFAAGLDPTLATVFVQSHVHAHLRLAYLLECTAHIGELSRMIQFKEKGHQPGTRASLFTYPCLMSADILLYETHRVPVGRDQSQHVELARDLAIRFNATYGDTFVVPELEPAAIASGVLDLQNTSRKMSKSAPHNAPGVIRILDPADVIVRKVRRAVTDSDSDIRYDPQAKPGISNLIDILAVLSGRLPEAVVGQTSTYSQLKNDVAEAIIDSLAPIKSRHDQLMSDRVELHRLLSFGADKACEVADPTLNRAIRAIGLA